MITILGAPHRGGSHGSRRGLRRSIDAFVLAAGVALASPLARAGDDDATFTLVADRDDDDLDGLADSESPRVVGHAAASLRLLDARFEGATFTPSDKKVADMLRLVVDGVAQPWGRAANGKVALQGRRAGQGSLIVRLRDGREERVPVVVYGLSFRGADGKEVDPVKGRASLQRTPPELAPAPRATYADPDALRVELRVPAGREAPTLGVEAFSATNVGLDAVPRLKVDEVPCGGEQRCFVSAPLRFVVDDIDRSHPVAVDRSLRGEVGGAVVVRIADKVHQSLRVEGPRLGKDSALPRTKANVRALVLRVSPGGAPAIGGNDAGAVALMRSELALASATWGQCGVSFGRSDSLDIKVVDPPPSHLVAFGNDLGLPATGGELAFRIDGRAVSLHVAARATPDVVAREFAALATKAGFKTTLSPNARIGPGASGSVDVLVRRRSGVLAIVEATSSTESSLAVRVGRVDLSDGLQHFGDMDSMAGTLEERTLLKAFDDGDPSTLEVFVVPAFASGGRIGESFIASDLSSIRNVVILDRAGLRARRSSLTLAHELGHVLLNMPGHPDDFGVDTPTMLMDSDAADASAFGPRRLSLDDCARAMREAGPGARTPLLKLWPIEPLGPGR